MFGAYSVPWSSPPAPQAVNKAAAEIPTNKFFTKRISRNSPLFKILFIHFRGTGIFQDTGNLVFALTGIQSEVDRHNMLVVRASDIELAWPVVRLQITRDH